MKMAARFLVQRVMPLPTAARPRDRHRWLLGEFPLGALSKRRRPTRPLAIASSSAVTLECLRRLWTSSPDLDIHLLLRCEESTKALAQAGRRRTNWACGCGSVNCPSRPLSDSRTRLHPDTRHPAIPIEHGIPTHREPSAIKRTSTVEVRA